MHLINVDTYDLHEFVGEKIPRYAILSHTWGDEEVSYKDMQILNDHIKKKQGFRKIYYTCQQAKVDKLWWAWVDTCCIDKTSSAELTEAINSMYAWYKNSARCYAYLADVPPDDNIKSESSAFRRSLWFARGWTLQELLAPCVVIFYAWDWTIVHKLERDQRAFLSYDYLLSDITG